MRGIVECINWIANNPDKELECATSIYANRRMKEGVIQCANENIGGQYWLTSDNVNVFINDDWQPYDPNPEVEFHVAYMDCLENNVKYVSENGYHLIGVNGEVKFEWVCYENLIGYQLNWSKWKKVL